MLALAWPMLQNQIAASAMPESAARMRDTLFLVRSYAMIENRRVRIRFAPEEQFPSIEIERDPIEHPGEWEAVDEAWVREPILLGDVQVHSIEAGRPIYLEPISFDESTDQAEEDLEEEQEDELEGGEDETTGFDATAPSITMMNEEIELDEHRPMIIYESDGSTDWATMRLTEVPLEKELTEEDNQLWVVLDGRTGLAYIREQVTEEQLADEEFYIKRENLEFPDDTSADDLAFGVQEEGEESGGPAGGFGGGGGLQGGLQGAGGMPSLGAIQSGMDGLAGEVDIPGRNNAGGRGPNPGDLGAEDRGGPRTDGDVKDGSRNPRSDQNDLGDDMDGSDLSKDERENIDEALNNDNRNAGDQKPDDPSNGNANTNANANINANNNSNANQNANSNSNSNTNNNLNGNSKG
ncbi:MAG TPA: hypothetical protein VNT79_05020 [Phycisphaerae bacterium]|nr:hypothetical protein [Phycisphaerae bacterium]